MLGLIAGPLAGQAVPGTERFQTGHQRAASPIELRHLLLPFSSAKQSATSKNAAVEIS